MRINRFTFLSIEYNCYNGFFLELLGVDMISKKNIDSALFGFGITRDYLQLSIFYKTFEVTI